MNHVIYAFLKVPSARAMPVQNPQSWHQSQRQLRVMSGFLSGHQTLSLWRWLHVCPHIVSSPYSAIFRGSISLPRPMLGSFVTSISLYF